ncbi:MAG: hypothetical protein FWF63_11020 [Fibromonadales bacterium]|nr:hypothetical protein [Fibromonadales bacterium]
MRKTYGKLLFAGAAIATIFIARKMFLAAIITGVVCVLIVEIMELIKKRIEKNKLTCNECFHFMRNDIYTKPQYIGFCCRKQKKLGSCKICSHFLDKAQK